MIDKVKQNAGKYANLLILVVIIFLSISLYRNISRIQDAKKEIREIREGNEELKQ